MWIPWESLSGNANRIDIIVFYIAKPMIFKGLSQELHVKRDIVPNDNGISDKIKKSRKNGSDFWSCFQHFIRNSSKISDKVRYIDLDIGAGFNIVEC